MRTRLNAQRRRRVLKKQLLPVLVCILALLAAGCATVPAASLSGPGDGPTLSPAPLPTASPAPERPRPAPDDPDEARLLAAAEAAAGNELSDHVCLDLDRNGAKELLGVCYSPVSQCNEVWYCSGDGTTCTMVHRDKLGLESCFLEELALEDESHVAVNSHVGMGTTSFFSILALRDGEIVCLVDEQPGNVRMTEEGDVTLSVEAYDGMYDAATDAMLGHTVKSTYLFFDGESYREYGATELTEEQFLAYKNAGELKAEIAHDLRFEDYDRLEYHYFLRSNGILQIQCDLCDAYGGVQYGYYTVRCLNGEVETSPGERESGRMAPSLSTLEVVY